MVHMIVGGSCGSAVSPLVDRNHTRLTTSFGIVEDSLGIVIDNGYGVQTVAAFLLEHGVTEVVYLQTHYHLDHVAGLPLNALLFNKKIKQRGFFGPLLNIQPKDAWSRMFDPAFWPVHPGMLSIDVPIEILTPTRDSPLYKDYGITYMDLNHPGGCVGYRIPTGAGDIVIATDHEPGESVIDAKYQKFVNRAKVLITDIQYRHAEHMGLVGIGSGPPMSRAGWGHATPQLLGSVLTKVDYQPDIVIATHHDPTRPDADLQQFGREVTNTLVKSGAGHAFMAADGYSFKL